MAIILRIRRSEGVRSLRPGVLSARACTRVRRWSRAGVIDGLTYGRPAATDLIPSTVSTLPRIGIMMNVECGWRPGTESVSGYPLIPRKVLFFSLTRSSRCAPTLRCRNPHTPVTVQTLSACGRPIQLFQAHLAGPGQPHGAEPARLEHTFVHHWLVH